MRFRHTFLVAVILAAAVASLSSQEFPPDFGMFAMDIGPGWSSAEEVSHPFFDASWKTTRGPFTLTYHVSFGDPIGGEQTSVLYLAGVTEFDELELIRGEQYDFWLEEWIPYTLFSILDRNDWVEQRRTIVYGWLDQGNFTPMVLTISVPDDRYDELREEMILILGIE